ncbi:MAG TPA: hypothetical protein VLI67_00190 [Vicinamibacteria bacterium]|nr:hypothetical protein [Vicinamibacteria bacterium]
MFVGHYAPSFLAKRLDPGIPLWLLFLAVQLLDVFWAIFIFIGVERVRIVPGFTETNALDLYYMPYTHSLPGALAWAAAAAISYRLLTGSSRGGALVGAAVFSHWPLDLLVHRPDLALYDDAAKVGLGLWDYPYLTLALEGALLLGAMGLYMSRSPPLTRRGRLSMPAFGLAILLMQGGMLFSPPPPSERAMAITALVAYALFAAAIAWLERGRAVEERPPGGASD